MRGGGVLLALETSGMVGSVAVGVPGAAPLSRILLEERRQHAARLVPAARDALEDAGVPMSELAGVVVGQGPGSFTGVRVAAATGKGLAHALRVPLWPVSSLAAAAVSPGWEDGEGDPAGAAAELGAEGDGGPGGGSGAGPGGGEGPSPGDRVRYVLFDARDERVYAACYRVAADGVEVLVPPRAGTLGRVLAPPPPAGAVFAGSGARRHGSRIIAAGFAVAPAPAGDPSAEGLLRWLGLEGSATPAEDPGLWEPTYLRPGSARVPSRP